MVSEILVIDDELEVGAFFDFFLRKKGYHATVAYSWSEGKKVLQSNIYDLALVDLKLPDGNGLEILKRIKSTMPSCEVVIMTGYSTVKSAVEAIKFGAYDYIEKPFDELEDLESVIEAALTARKESNRGTEQLCKEGMEFGIVMGTDSPMQQVLKVARKIATRKINILVQGETGTGKELIARYIHAKSFRAGQPFIAINCSAFTETLMDSELFGHEKGAFTGALDTKKGIFELANKGTLLLDEVVEASPQIQAKLLRVLETGKFYRVGGQTPISVDVRVIAATNADLDRAVSEGKFREDLFYRLDVVTIHLPPLRQRRDDILPLIQHFIKKNLSAERSEVIIALTTEALQMLIDYDWPGNVRELANVIAQAMALSIDNGIDVGMLPEKITKRKQSSLTLKEGLKLADSADTSEIIRQWGSYLTEILIKKGKLDLRKTIDQMSLMEDKLFRDIIQHALESVEGNRTKAAESLNVSTRVVRYYLDK